MFCNSEHELNVILILSIQIIGLCECSVSPMNDSLEVCFLAKSNYLVGILEYIMTALRVSAAVS